MQAVTHSVAAQLLNDAELVAAQSASTAAEMSPMRAPASHFADAQLQRLLRRPQQFSEPLANLADRHRHGGRR